MIDWKWIYFQEDNVPKHSSKLCRSYLKHKETEGVLKKTWCGPLRARILTQLSFRGKSLK